MLSEPLAGNRFRYFSEEHQISPAECRCRRRISLATTRAFIHLSAPVSISIASVMRSKGRSRAATSSKSSTVSPPGRAPDRSAAWDSRPTSTSARSSGARPDSRRAAKASIRWRGRPASGSILAAAAHDRRGGGSLSASRATPVRAPEPPARWRDYASRLKVGDRVDVATGGGRRFIADLVAVDDSSISVKPVVRIPEPTRPRAIRSARAPRTAHRSSSRHPCRRSHRRRGDRRRRLHDAAADHVRAGWRLVEKRSDHS